MVLLVKKGDKRACVFDALVGGTVPEGGFKMTLKSHPGKAVARFDKWNKGDGELMWMGDAADAHTVAIETKDDVHWIKSCDHKNRWLEIPCNEHEENYAMWFRTLHSRNKDYFAWQVNDDGTISSHNKQDLVLGLGMASDGQFMGHVKGHFGVGKSMEIAGFENVTPGEQKLGNKLNCQQHEDWWVEIPHADMKIPNNLWMRTLHGGQPHFSYKFNADGTISPQDDPDIVFGLTDPSTGGRFIDSFANHLGWKRSRVEVKEEERKQNEKLAQLVQEQVDAVIDEKMGALTQQMQAMQMKMEEMMAMIVEMKK